MTINKKQRIVIISALLLICLVGVAYFFYEQRKERTLPKDDFLTNLWKTCPLYAPSAVGYRTCIDNLLDQKQKEANLALNALTSNVQAQIIADRASAPEASGWLAETAFLENLSTLNKSWKPYQDALCKTEAAGLYGGNGQGDAVEECQIRETELFIGKLAKYKEGWVKN